MFARLPLSAQHGSGGLAGMFKCPACQSDTHYRLDNFNLEGHQEVLWGMSTTASLMPCRLVVCSSCGRLEVFLADPTEWAKRERAALVEPEGAGPYR
jgi:hypothetical protein